MTHPRPALLPRAGRAALIAAGMLLAAAEARPARAQNAAAPSAHWGMLAFPEFQPVQQVGFQTFLFTEYGKPGEGAYGDGQLPTLGINLLTFANNRILDRRRSLDSNLLFNSTLVLGFTHDRFTEFLQNDVQHNLLNIARVPRGRTRDWGPAVGYVGEIVYRFLSSSWSGTGDMVAFPTPLFLSAGFQLGTLYQEGYAALGAREAVGPYFFWQSLRPFFYLSISAMARAGVLMRGPIFSRVAPAYFLGQATVAAHLLESFFPIRIELGISGHSGFFVDPQSRALAERFWNGRVLLGDFTFEVSNDQLGDKDSGPTVGARAFLNLVPGTSLRRLKWLLSNL